MVARKTMSENEKKLGDALSAPLDNAAQSLWLCVTCILARIKSTTAAFDGFPPMSMDIGGAGVASCDGGWPVFDDDDGTCACDCDCVCVCVCIGIFVGVACLWFILSPVADLVPCSVVPAITLSIPFSPCV